jgi:hypothetical protein
MSDVAPRLCTSIHRSSSTGSAARFAKAPAKRYRERSALESTSAKSAIPLGFARIPPWGTSNYGDRIIVIPTELDCRRSEAGEHESTSICFLFGIFAEDGARKSTDDRRCTALCLDVTVGETVQVMPAGRGPAGQSTLPTLRFHRSHGRPSWPSFASAALTASSSSRNVIGPSFAASICRRALISV